MVKKTLGYNFQFPVTYKYQNTFHGLLTSFCRNQATKILKFKNCEPTTYVFPFLFVATLLFLPWYYEMEIQMQKRIINFEKRNNK